MASVMVERATSDLLVGPDWAKNLEICDICNYDPKRAKDIVKSIRRRLDSKSAKVQLLALSLLEAIVKNCGDNMHKQIAEKELPHEMVKIVKKKPDFHVREKILILIDTWQEAFGGPKGKYRQYFAAYQDLLRLGTVFPQRFDATSPIFTPQQTHPLASYPQNLRNHETRPAAAETSAEAEFPRLSLTEIQKARGIMEVLSEMLNALDPRTKEGINEDVIVDLVEQCRTYKHRVVNLVNSTADESLLCQGLRLNDDLERLLAKHNSISSAETQKPEIDQPLVKVDAPLIETSIEQQSSKGSTLSADVGEQSLLPAAPAETKDQLTTQPQPDLINIDLLGGDGFDSPTPNSLALVPAGEVPPPTSAGPQQHPLDLVDMFSPSYNYQTSNAAAQEPHSSPAYFQQRMNNVLSPEASSSHLKVGVFGPMLPHYEQQLASPMNGSPSRLVFPPPPWEAHPDDIEPAAAISQPIRGGGHLTMMINQTVVPQHPPPTVVYPAQPTQLGYMYPHQVYGNEMAGYGYGYRYGFGYVQGQGQPQNVQFFDQTMSGLSLRDESALRNTYYSYAQPAGKPLNPEDKVYGDIVDVLKPPKTTPGNM